MNTFPLRTPGVLCPHTKSILLCLLTLDGRSKFDNCKAKHIKFVRIKFRAVVIVDFFSE